MEKDIQNNIYFILGFLASQANKAKASITKPNELFENIEKINLETKEVTEHGNITKQYETKDRSDIVRKILRVVPHRILYHAIQFFHDKLHDILKRIGHFRRMLHLSVRSDRKRQQKKHD